MVLVKLPDKDKPIVLWVHYNKRTTQKEPKMIAPDTLKCSASMLEADGIRNCLKKILHPDQDSKMCIFDAFFEKSRFLS